MKRALLVVLCAAPAAAAEPPPATEIVTLSTAADTAPERPAWFDRAGRLFREGWAAESAGDVPLADRRYRQTLKLLADRADDAAVLEFRPGLSAFLGVTAEDPPPAAGDAARTSLSPAPAPVLKPAAPDYAFPVNPEDPLVKKYMALFAGPLKDRTQAALDRMARHRDMILEEIRRVGLPEELLYLPLIESEYQLFAVSRAGAVGLWQFMPATAKYAGLKINYWIDERRDPAKATRAALQTLKGLYDWFNDWQLALAAYNRGLYGIQRDLEFTRSADFSMLSQRQGLPAETEHYVPKLMAVVLLLRDPGAHGFTVSSSQPPRAEEVVLEKPLDLKIAAGCAGVAENVLRELNPSVRLWCTPQNEPRFTLRVPAGSKDRFLAALAQVKDWTPSPGVIKYKVRPGDVLGRIAQRYRTTSAALQRENSIKNPKRLRPGQTLLIRPGRGFKGD